MRTAQTFLLFAALLFAGAPTLAQQSGPTNGQLSTGPVVAPTNTVGNTPSSVTNRSNTSSGYSARGNTSNTNLNNTQVGNRGTGVPVGNGSQTSANSTRLNSSSSTSPTSASTAPTRLSSPASNSSNASVNGPTR